ncbi:MAG TPA: hypothetical protein VF669_19165 [Tepidisphaeraceae bacterium]|jgi:Flp pilus assembly pilin Flp
MRKVIESVLRDECGGETLEYSLIAALLVIAGLMVMTKLGVKAAARWTSLEEAL